METAISIPDVVFRRAEKFGVVPLKPDSVVSLTERAIARAPSGDHLFVGLRAATGRVSPA